MKILHIITSLNKGGAENHLAQLVELQSKQKKNEINIIYFRGDDYWSEILKKKKIKVERFTIKKNYDFISLFFQFIKIFFYIRKLKPKIVHAHLGLSEIMSVIFKKFFKLKFKLIVTKHLDSFLFEGSRGQNRFLSGIFFERIIFKTSAQIIFISKNVRSYFLSEIKVPSKKISVIYYGINKNYFFKKKDVKAHKLIMNKKKNEKYILNIARHVPQKKIDLLIKSFAQYEKINQNTKLILVGKGIETQSLKILAKKMNIYDKIYWIDYTENIYELFKISDLFCLTSEYEGLGLVLLESFLAKVPIITMDRSAMKEVIKNNYSGLLLPANSSPKTFSKAISKVLNNKKLSKKIIKNGLVTLNEKFNPYKMLNLTTNIYNKK
ncbi:glycosyltransferase family 4 protein [Candidatus Pelagibacter sp.]|nr:glycosyltransferase family 4 protein [Candidatus Pelagibacter sp.]